MNCHMFTAHTSTPLPLNILSKCPRCGAPAISIADLPASADLPVSREQPTRKAAGCGQCGWQSEGYEQIANLRVPTRRLFAPVSSDDSYARAVKEVYRERRSRPFNRTAYYHACIRLIDEAGWRTARATSGRTSQQIRSEAKKAIVEIWVRLGRPRPVNYNDIIDGLDDDQLKMTCKIKGRSYETWRDAWKNHPKRTHRYILKAIAKFKMLQSAD